MRSKLLLNIFLMIVGLIATRAYADNLPAGFVYLKNVDPSIVQEMRYFSYHNFVGRPIKGYEAAECILTKPAADALHKVQVELKRSMMSLKVYDCYRPQMAVDDFYAWSQLPDQQQMKAEFYPRVNKADFFKLGYVIAKSGHTRGSTMDLTIIPLHAPAQPTYRAGQHLVSCFALHDKRYHDNSIDMGTGYDCMDVLAHGDNKDVGQTAYENRMMLREVMEKYGFAPYPEEWWHFTLKNEPYPNTYFNFPVK